MNSFQFQTVSNIISGLGSINQLGSILQSQNYHKALLVTDQGMIQHQLHLPILKILDQIGLYYIIYSDIQADPPEHLVLEAVEFAKQEQIDVVIGFGGGSSMDVAKLIALLAHPQQQQHLTEIYGVNQAKAPRLALILVPTTAGTGSEVTPISIVTTGATTKWALSLLFFMQMWQF